MRKNTTTPARTECGGVYTPEEPEHPVDKRLELIRKFADVLTDGARTHEALALFDRLVEDTHATRQERPR